MLFTHFMNSTMSLTHMLYELTNVSPFHELTDVFPSHYIWITNVFPHIIRINWCLSLMLLSFLSFLLLTFLELVLALFTSVVSLLGKLIFTIIPPYFPRLTPPVSTACIVLEIVTGIAILLVIVIVIFQISVLCNIVYLFPPNLFLHPLP